jgi:predicted ATPase
MSELANLLNNTDVRLITILGAGGMGKTRLALETARTHLSRFADGVYFVPLAPLSSAEHIMPTIAERVGFQFHRESNPQEQLLRYFTRKRMLLVMDNFEHLLDGVALVTEILGAAPGVTILATSREKLALSAETIYTVVGLPFPDGNGAQKVEAHSAIGLFMQSAQHTRADFALHGDDLQQVARICQLVQGMPLAILLAASWVDVLALEEIAEEIRQSLDLLQTDLRDMPIHQRSIRATFDRSWQRLSAIEREIFMRLSVFRGGCTREAIQAVTSASLPVIHALVSKSLLWRLPDGGYDVHELLRQYAAERLDEAGEAGPARDAHCAYFMAFAHSLEAEVKSRRQQSAFSKIEADFENIRRAWNWATERRNFDGVDQALESVFLYCEREGRFEEGMELFEQARETLAPRPGEEPHLVWARALIHFHSDKGQIEQGLAIARQHNAVAEIAWCYQLFGEWALEVGDHAASADWFQYRVDLLKSIEGWYDMVLPLEGLGYSLLFLRKFEEAIEAFELGIELGKRSGDMLHLAKNMGGVRFCPNRGGRRLCRSGANYSGSYRSAR